MSSDGFERIASTDDVEPGEGRQVELGGEVIALFNVDGTFHAIGGTCTHRGGPLGDGMLEGNEVTCPLHGATFDVTTGNVAGPPAFENVACYEVRITGNDIEVKKRDTQQTENS